MQKKWSKCNNIINKYTSTNKYVRPEVVISCIARLKGLQTTKKFHEKFSQMSVANYNLNHEFLAYIVKKGGGVYTTNFDTCIEQVYEKKYNEKLTKQIYCGGKVVLYETEHDGKVCHLHGTFEYSEQAGASIENVMSGFDQFTLQMLERDLKEGIHIFVGYSFSDDYDLNSIFTRYVTKPEKIYVCNHMGIDKKMSLSVQKLFGTQIHVFNKDTTTFLAELNGQVKFRKLFEEGENEQDWKCILKYSGEMDDFSKDLYMIEMLNEFKICCKTVDKKIAKICYKDERLNELGEYRDILLYGQLFWKIIKLVELVAYG